MICPTSFAEWLTIKVGQVGRSSRRIAAAGRENRRLTLDGNFFSVAAALVNLPLAAPFAVHNIAPCIGSLAIAFSSSPAFVFFGRR